MPQPVRPQLPPVPDEPQQEGSRWRWHKPSSEAVAHWFTSVPLDEGMRHEDYVGGVVIIPQTEKVKHQLQDGMHERYEQVFTPYVQIGTRVGYSRRLAEHRGLRLRIAPEVVPRTLNPGSPYFNGNFPDGLWWHVIVGDIGATRYLCATYSVQMFEPQEYARRLRGELAMPVLEGSGTKQVAGGADPNGLMRAQTGAIGRALGVAGILVIGTGIATAEDMQEYIAAPTATPDQALLPPSEIAPGAPPAEAEDSDEALTQLRARAVALQARMQEETPLAERAFMAWWQERRIHEGWESLGDVPLEALRGVVTRMETLHAEALANEQTGVPA